MTLSLGERAASMFLFAHVGACARCSPIGKRISTLQRSFGGEPPTDAGYAEFQALIDQLCPIGLRMHNTIVAHAALRITGERS